MSGWLLMKLQQRFLGKLVQSGGLGSHRSSWGIWQDEKRNECDFKMMNNSRSTKNWTRVLRRKLAKPDVRGFSWKRWILKLILQKNNREAFKLIKSLTKQSQPTMGTTQQPQKQQYTDWHKRCDRKMERIMRRSIQSYSTSRQVHSSRKTLMTTMMANHQY